MFTLRGIFPAPQKECKKNFIKENVRQLRNMQNNRQPARSVGVKKTKSPAKPPPKPTLTNKSSEIYQKSEVSVPRPQSSDRLCVHAATKLSDAPLIRKADMNEYLRRKMLRDSKPPPTQTEYYKQSTDNVSSHKDIGCQYTDPDATHFFADGTKLRIIYPSKKILDTLEMKNNDEKSQEVGNTIKYEKNIADKNSRLENKKKEASNSKVVQSRYLSNTNLNGNAEDSNRSTASIQSPVKLDPNTSGDKANPLLPPATYQKGVVPRYIKDMKQKKGQRSEKQSEQKGDDLSFSDADSQCPPGHMALPESERVETLKILKEKFSSLIDELNRMPVRTDTLRMKNRKMQLDKELSKLEEGIKVFSRPKVYVNIDI